MPQDVTIKMPDGRFNYRVGAIILHEGKVLMARNSGSTFYYTIGGRARFGEATRETVLREAFEETGIRFEIDRLVFIHENFFVMESDSEVFHEVALFFLMKPNSEAAGIADSFAEEYGDVSLHWLPVDGLEGSTVYPEFFKTELRKLSEGVKHFVTRDGETWQAV
jgi:8-oxo-dGTP pyrophosphatase MutT (NUDIX family)